MNTYLVISMIASFLSLFFAWRAWVNSSNAREDLRALHAKMRKDLQLGDGW